MATIFSPVRKHIDTYFSIEFLAFTKVKTVYREDFKCVVSDIKYDLHFPRYHTRSIHLNFLGMWWCAALDSISKSNSRLTIRSSVRSTTEISYDRICAALWISYLSLILPILILTPDVQSQDNIVQSNQSNIRCSYLQVSITSN